MNRLDNVTPFLVMDVLRKAQSIPDAIHFEVGQPDIPPSPAVIEAMVKATQAQKIRYTESLGLLALREKIAAFYQQRYQVEISPARIVLTVGTSGAFLISYAILLNAGDKLLLTDPGYPCYKNFAHILNAQPVFVPIDHKTDYQLTVEHLTAHQNIKAIQISSPSNPIGNVYSPATLKALIDYSENHGIYFISDEIYHGLVYGKRAHTALEFSDNAIVINGFSKYFCLPGLRLGWVILPPHLVRKAEIVMQNLYISAPTISQYGALAAFDDEHLTTVTATFQKRRDYLYHELSQLFTIDTQPEGAFYIWANISNYSENSLKFSELLLDKIHIATTSGIDFGQNKTHQFLRFAYTREIAHLKQGVERLKAFLANE
ncbi:aminotransferase, classes I and II [Beggiatoa sp. PS]|nr:aminotransferase, classes I and II [Beggiatoa sp. PS]